MNEAVLAQKLANLARCVARARQEHGAAGAQFRLDFTRQDAAVLNVQRACETAVDLANMLIRDRRLGLPAHARDSFALLARHGLIDDTLNRRLQAMVGFRNVAVHQYRDLDLDILEAVITQRLDDVLRFADAVRRLGTQSSGS